MEVFGDKEGILHINKELLKLGGESSVFNCRANNSNNLYSFNFLILVCVKKVGSTEGNADKLYSKCVLFRNSRG